MAAARTLRRALAALGLVTGLLVGLTAPAGAVAFPRPVSLDDLVARAAAAAAVTAEERCRPEPGTAVPDMVGQIFRCRLEGRFPDDEVRRIATEAVVVAQCESLFDPTAIVFDGAYLDRRHPMTGMYYSAAGVFQFIRKTADKYIEGGYANAIHPVPNIQAAADLYLDNRANGRRGWEDWECSAVNGAFKSNSVLPGWPGGPAELPAWAWEH